MDDSTVRTRIWNEEPEPDNPFAARRALCHGFDVFGDVLGKANLTEYLFLLFAGEPPSAEQARLLNDLAVALANPGPRDHSVLAAMAGGAGGSTFAASLMAALAAGAGQHGGAHEVAEFMELWNACGDDVSAWSHTLRRPSQDERADIWKRRETPPGFDPHGSSCPGIVLGALERLSTISPKNNLRWLKNHRVTLETIAEVPLNMVAVAAGGFRDLGFDSSAGEMLFLLLRLPGAAAHALEQQGQGWRSYPFFKDGLTCGDEEANQ